MEITRYVTEGSFDAFMWQTLETKARFTNQIMTGDTSVRRAEDIGGQELSYAEVKAIASGNPAVLTVAEAGAELQRLTILKKNHADAAYLARRNIRELPGTIDRLTQRIAGLTADMETMERQEGITVAGRKCTYKDALNPLADRLAALPRHVYQKQRVKLGTYRGLTFGAVLNPPWSPEIYLEGAVTRLDTLSRDSHGPRAVMSAVERIAGGYAADRETTKRNLAVAQTQLQDYQARLGQPFEHEQYLTELAGLRDALRASLSATPAEGAPGSEGLAEKIKALKAAHAVEAAPLRTGKRSASAEEPVTARIRRRSKAVPAAEPAITPDAASPPPAATVAPESAAPANPGQLTASHDAGMAPDVSLKLAKTYQERVATERRQKEYQTTLF